jgi:hypothetical protein
MSVKVEIVPEKGRAVIARRKFKKGEIIESCPVIILGKDDFSWEGTLGRYVFYWPGPRQGSSKTLEWTRTCIPLGYGSIYNHDPNPNADFRVSVRRRELIFFAKRDIDKGEEITHNYCWPKSWYRKVSWYKKGRERT